MSQRKDGEKAPFEKVVIQRDVKKILQELLQEKKELYCKGENDIFFGFRPDGFDQETGLTGKIVVLDAKPAKTEKVVVNFAAGADRYFTVATYEPGEGRGVLKFTGVLYRLERREHLRIPLTDKMEKSCNIIHWIDKVVFITTDIKDISQGGVRLTFPLVKSRPAQIGDQLKIVLHIKQKWQVEILAEIRHIGIQEDLSVLGLQFVINTDSDFKKILSLTMELQREYVRSENNEV